MAAGRTGKTESRELICFLANKYSLLKESEINTMEIQEISMLLNPNDFKFEYYQQERGEGLSGSLYLGTPKREGLCPILVKSARMSDAINEYLACNIGLRIGVSTSRAWLFDPKIKAKEKLVNFHKAVAIEFHEDFDVKSPIDTENDAIAIQVIKGVLLHLLMNEEDRTALAQSGGKVYAFDFAISLIPKDWGEDTIWNRIFPINKLRIAKMRREEPKTTIWGYLREKYKQLPEDLVYTTFIVFRSDFMDEYERNGFSDLLENIRYVFSEEASDFAKCLLQSVHAALNSLWVNTPSDVQREKELTLKIYVPMEQGS